MKNLTSGAEFHKFDNEPIFYGKYLSPVKHEKDSDEKKPDGTPRHLKGDVMGYNFEDAEGEIHIIGNSDAVQKSIAQVQPGEIVGFKFLGKTQNKHNQPVNRFKIDQFDNWDEAEKYYYPDNTEDNDGK